MSPLPSFDLGQYADKVSDYARAHLAIADHEVTIAGHMHLLTTAAERDLLQFGNAHELAQVACAPGCCACCVVNIAVLVPEAITIAWFLKRTLSPSQLAAVRQSLNELHHSSRWLDDEERLFLRKSCALLDPEGTCSVHKVRPLLCRSITSCDRDVCQEAITQAPLDGTPYVPMNLFQKAFFEATYQGLAKGLAQMGLDDRPWRLTTAIDSLMEDPSLVARFAAGAQIVHH